jgi:hypothetical protein
MAKTIRFLAAAVLLGIAVLNDPALQVRGAELALKVVDKEPPKDLDASIRDALQSKAVQLIEGENPAFEIWFRTEIPLKSPAESAEKALQSVREAALLGIVIIGSDRRDYKDNDLAKGVYTARFAFQPQDGNHLGTAEHPFFAVLTPVKRDTKLDGISDYKTLVKASSKDTPSDHPIILSMRPASSTEGEFPKQNEPAPEHKSVRIKIPAKAPDSSVKSSLVFELVYEGKGKL